MINICSACGLYRADQIVDPVDPTGPVVICPECGKRRPFVRLPLLVVTGASGAGKSTVCNRLLGRVRDAVILDSDILWRPEFNTPEDGYRAYFDLWLRVCKNINQSGRPVVLFGAGIGVPANLAPSVECRYFSAIHYLALVCSDDALAQRLQARPAWRNAAADAYIAEHQQFNRWFRTYGDRQPPIDLLDTTHVNVEATTCQVAAWIDTTIRPSLIDQRG